ncbi:DUF4040 domain-containing protein [Clostridiales bacterium COT073_COT-073]|nr:DUF4040 domain-containing protein [Clostridiales bacterium COT073_COT-073]
MTIFIIQNILLVLLVIFALAAIHTHSLRHAVIYLGVYSLASSLVYLLYGAADVAIAEAVIGCTLSTILFLVALKKYQVFILYYKIDDPSSEAQFLRRKLKQLIRRFAYEVLDFQIDTTTTKMPLAAIINDHDFDIIIHHTPTEIICYGIKDNYHFPDLKEYLEKNFSEPIRFLELEERSQDVFED